MKIKTAKLIKKVKFENGVVLRLGDIDEVGGVIINISKIKTEEGGVNVIRVDSNGEGWDENYDRLGHLYF